MRLAVGLAAAVAMTGSAMFEPAAAQKRGGVLDFVVGSKIPSYDGHSETTLG